MTSQAPSPTITYYEVDTNKSVVYGTSYLYKTPYDRHEYITTVTLVGLKAATIYTYTIAAEKTGPVEATYSFKTLPVATDPVNIILYGDLGWEGEIMMSKDAGGLNSWVERRLVDFIVHYGDLAYNLAGNNGTTGDQFMHNLMPIATRLPYVTTAGNHEYAEKSEDLYRNWFIGQKLLGERSSSPDPVMWHSYDVGDYLHMVGINTEIYCEDQTYIGDQMVWLEKDLAAVRARTVQPWIVVYGHRQIYDGDYNAFHSQMMRYGLQCTDSTKASCSFTPCTSGTNCEYSLEKIFDDYKIDMYFAGHMHAYSRMLPIAPGLQYETQEQNEHVNAQSPVYVVSGAAGLEKIVHRGEQHHIQTPELMSGNGGASIYFNSANHTFTAMTVYNTTHLYMRQIMLNDVVMDSLWMIKDPAKPAWNVTASFTLAAPPQSNGQCDQ